MMTDVLKAHAANAVTAGRIVMTIPFVACVMAQKAALGWVAGLLFVAIAASDVFDGRIARRYGSASEVGKVLDHIADIGFLLIALSTFVHIGAAPWWVPAAIAFAFGFYVVDSWRRSAPTKPNLIGSRIGHAGGMMNYTVVGVLVFNRSAEIGLLPDGFMMGLFALVPIYSAAAVASRLAARTG